MRTQLIKNIQAGFLFLFISLSLTACSGFFDKDNTPEPTPLSNFKPEIRLHRLWTAKTGNGTADEYIKMNPALGENAIFTTSSNGFITAINKTNGSMRWQSATRLPLATGPGLGAGMVIATSRKGDIIALKQTTGERLWQTSVTGEILATPAIDENKVIIKTTDGYVHALSAHDGQERWSFHQTEPSLILRAASAPSIQDNSVITGFANGNLAKLNLDNGQLQWLQTIAIPEGAFAIQRMIDIDADPVLFEHHIYAATYQGKIVSLDWNSGGIRWTHDISSYTGMAVDDHAAYISDARSLVWAFNVKDGSVNWQQNKLAARVISAPAIMNDYIVVGDAQGYLHWLNKQDGHFAARESAGAAVYATPLTENNRVYVLTSNGSLIAYTLG